MLIPNKFNGYRADGRRVYPVGGGVGEAMLLGAAMGGGSAAITGGDPLKGALLGGLTGGIGSGISGALAGAPEAATLASTTNAPASLLSSQTAGTALNNLSAYTPSAGVTSLPGAAMGTAGGVGAGGIANLGVASDAITNAAMQNALPLTGQLGTVPMESFANNLAMTNPVASSMPIGTPIPPAGGIPGAMPVGTEPVVDISAKKITLPPVSGPPGSAAYLNAEASNIQLPLSGTGVGPVYPSSLTPNMSPAAFGETPFSLANINAANAGMMVTPPIETSAIPADVTTKPAVPVNAQPNLFKDPTAYIKAHPYLAGSSALAGALGGRREMEKPGEYEGPLKRFRFDPSTYRPGFADGGIAALPAGYDRKVGEDAAYPKFAQGGISDLGSYSDGGRMLRGPGDGMSDNIPGVIAGKRPARLADGEFVVPADVVSHLGNGSTDAGAKQLYAMMDKVRQARTGRKAQGREINPRKYMPA